MKWRSLQEPAADSETRLLRQIFAERQELIAKYVPPAIQAVHERTVTALKAQSLATKALGVGETAPVFELSDQNGKRVSSISLLAKGPLVICFIRGRWCPFDVGQMELMSTLVDQIATVGGSLVAISPQIEKQAYFMHDQHKLRFPLLVDTHNVVGRQFGLIYRVPEEQQNIYRRTFVNLPFVNGDDSWELPIPGTYVIDHNGKILFASANEDYTERPEPLEVLDLLKTRA